MVLAPAVDSSPAAWFVNAEGPWHVKATYGPPGLEAYARISLGRGQDGSYYEAAEGAIFSSVLDTLIHRTTTPGRLWVGVWDGWGEAEVQGAHFAIPGREYVLLLGDVADLLDPKSYGLDAARVVIPHLVWPDDRAWFVCWDTDEDQRFTVGGSTAAIAELSRARDVTPETVAYGTPEEGWSW